MVNGGSVNHDYPYSMVNHLWATCDNMGADLSGGGKWNTSSLGNDGVISIVFLVMQLIS